MNGKEIVELMGVSQGATVTKGRNYMAFSVGEVRFELQFTDGDGNDKMRLHILTPDALYQYEVKQCS